MLITKIVVIYNKKITQSETLKSLIDLCHSPIAYNHDLKNNLIIYNNGPNELDCNCDLYFELEKIYSVTVVQCLENKPLSILYNECIHDFESNYYLILDDDTYLPRNFMGMLDFGKENNLDVIVPIIKASDGICYYPYINNAVVGDGNKIIKKDDIIKTISSGMIISYNVCQLISKEYGNIFDQSYALYGVDSSFCARLNRLKKKGEDISIGIGMVIDHDLSRVGRISKNNMKERVIDMAISFKKYPETISLKSIVKVNLKLIKMGYFSLLLDFLYAYLRGCHPRTMKSRL